MCVCVCARARVCVCVWWVMTLEAPARIMIMIIGHTHEATYLPTSTPLKTSTVSSSCGMRHNPHGSSCLTPSTQCTHPNAPCTSPTLRLRMRGDVKPRR